MKIPTGSTLYFDANIFIGINPKECNQLQELAAAENVKYSCPPRVWIELLSNINNDKKDEFEKYQAAFRKQKEICSAYILRHPQHVLANYFGLSKPLDELIPYGDFLQIRSHILNSEGYDEFLEKILENTRGVQNTVSGKLTPFENHFRDFRENYEKVWADVVSSWDDIFDPRRFLNTMIEIAGHNGPNELPANRVAELLKPIEAHFSAFRRVIEDNKKAPYNREELKNYWNDLELLLYLGLENHFFITCDKKLREKVDDTCEQKKRILTFNEAIEKLSDKSLWEAAI